MKIYKYDLESEPLEIPLIQILDIQIQDGKFVMWVMVNPERRWKKTIRAKFFQTGQDIPQGTLRGYEYKKTLQDSSGSIWHVFIKIEEGKES